MPEPTRSDMPAAAEGSAGSPRPEPPAPETPPGGAWRATLFGAGALPAPPFPVGILEGEGVGPEVIRSALAVLAAVAGKGGATFDVRTGGAIGNAAMRTGGRALSREVLAFCESRLDRGGAILAGAGGGRFVYDLRRELDLFVKLNPIRPAPEILGRGALRGRHAGAIDLLVVRDNAGGIYQGEWEERTVDGVRTAAHRFGYTEPQVRRIALAGARLARSRGESMCIAVKESGVPSVSRLWCDVSEAVAAELGVSCERIELDYAAYRMLASPESLGVVVTPNLVGDVLSDLGGVLLGSRALCHGASFDDRGRGVYQTNHGSAHDLAGTDRANPAGQILALASMLRESFGLVREATWIENALRMAWRRGARTADLAGPGERAVGTREMTDRVIEALEGLRP